MNTLNLILRDKNNKTIPLYRMSAKLMIPELRLYNILTGKTGYTLSNALKLSHALSLMGYDFPPETFMSDKEIATLNMYLKRWGIQTKKYNPIMVG